MDEYYLFPIEIPSPDPKEMLRFQAFMDEYAASLHEHVKDVAVILELSESAASDIVYLRGRDYWTQSLEDKLIAMYKGGTIPMNFSIIDWRG